MLKFQDKDFSVTSNSETLTLLPKEYALLRFLYENKNQPFTREDLLDRVWAMEAPVDRTVDDHIYRVRKKTKQWAHLFTIDTIRGRGYRLTLHQEPKRVNPLGDDPEVIESLRQLVRKYHLFGQGEALRVLADHQKALGLALEAKDEVWLKFNAFDVEGMVRQEEAGEERLYFLLFAYSYLQPDAAKTVRFFETALEKGVARFARLDLQLAMVMLYANAGQLKDAVAMFRSVEEEVMSGGFTGFYVFLRLHEFYLHFYHEDGKEAERIIGEIEEMLVQYPYQRERGIFYVAKGAWLLSCGRKREAEDLFAEGLQILRQSTYVPHLISAVRMIVRALGRIAKGSELERKYRRLWEELQEQYRFEEMRELVEAALLRGI